MSLHERAAATPKGGGEQIGWQAKYVRFDGSRYHPPCRCLDRLGALERLVGTLCEHLDVDADLLELLGRPTVTHGIPASWDECVALGIDPTGATS